MAEKMGHAVQYRPPVSLGISFGLSDIFHETGEFLKIEVKKKKKIKVKITKMKCEG